MRRGALPRGTTTSGLIRAGALLREKEKEKRTWDKHRADFICLMDRSHKKSTVTRWEDRRRLSFRRHSLPFFRLSALAASFAPLFSSLTRRLVWFLLGYAAEYMWVKKTFGGRSTGWVYKGRYKSFCLHEGEWAHFKLISYFFFFFFF